MDGFVMCCLWNVTENFPAPLPRAAVDSPVMTAACFSTFPSFLHSVITLLTDYIPPTKLDHVTVAQLQSIIFTYVKWFTECMC